MQARNPAQAPAEHCAILTGAGHFSRELLVSSIYNDELPHVLIAVLRDLHEVDARHQV
jgi:hypothetical protein